jgi:general stress protein YciG
MRDNRHGAEQGRQHNQVSNLHTVTPVRIQSLIVPRGESTMQTQKGRGRGFASMSPEKKREIASKGGKAAHALGTAHKWTSEEAQAAGRKGGSISRRRSKYNVQA